MKRTRKLAASMVVTVGVISACHPSGPDHPEPTRNPPIPTVTTSPTTETPTPEEPDVEPVNELPDVPIGQGELIREGELCFWLPASPELECPEDATCNPPPPPMRVEIECPAAEDTSLTVETRDDGTCFYMKYCPEMTRCNPPGPVAVDVPCPPKP